jgi:hypothetical protein
MQIKILLLLVLVICYGLYVWSLGVSLSPKPYLSIGGLLFSQGVLLYYSEFIVKSTIISNLTAAPRANVVVQQRLFNSIVNLGMVLIVVGKLCTKNGRWTGPRTPAEGVTLGIYAVFQSYSAVWGIPLYVRMKDHLAGIQSARLTMTILFRLRCIFQSSARNLAKLAELIHLGSTSCLISLRKGSVYSSYLLHIAARYKSHGSSWIDTSYKTGLSWTRCAL